MAKRDKSTTTLLAERMLEVKAQIVPRVAESMRPVYGNVTVNKKEQRARFWQVADDWSDEKERQLLTGLHPDGTPAFDAMGQPVKPLTPRQVGLLKFPNREIDAKAGGRADSLKMQAEYVREMAALGPPGPDVIAAQMPVPEMPAVGAQAQPSLGLGATMPAPPMAAPPADIMTTQAPVPPMQGG